MICIYSFIVIPAVVGIYLTFFTSRAVRLQTRMFRSRFFGDRYFGSDLFYYRTRFGGVLFILYSLAVLTILLRGK